MTEPTPLYDGMVAGGPATLPALPTPLAIEAPTVVTTPPVPPGPDLDALDRFAAALPDGWDRATAITLAAALRAQQAQITALTAHLL